MPGDWLGDADEADGADDEAEWGEDGKQVSGRRKRKGCEK